jgi:glutamate synthase (NADPH) large chain
LADLLTEPCERTSVAHDAKGLAMKAVPPGSSSGLPPRQGLYDPAAEHDACGVAFVATLTGEASHAIVAKAVTALRNLDHRGAVGAESNTGDGAGILLQVPDRFFREVTDFALPGRHGYAVGTGFLPADPEEAAATRARIGAIAAEEGLTVLGWRAVPTKPELLGGQARRAMPTFSQLFVASAGGHLGMALERRA